ncbi:disease resistance RPP13-like protein 4 isoform X2 [Magnolia sinica]|nr:disease resistance RPP13-like protein 4 isoform X2 [Magnolia sinica]XP_058096792.1 disease resistance RPP13-like protein 4 isoform X2 [Magnolia sinica]
MADAVASVLLNNLLSILISEGRQLLEFDDQFEETKEELQYMQSYLKVADQVKRRDRNDILKTVMSNLRELVYDAEDVLADYQLLFQKKHEGCAPNFTSYCFPTHLKSRHQFGKRLRKINQGVRKVKENMKSYVQTAPHQPGKDEDGGNMGMTYPILMHEAEMVGLEDDSAKIRKWILGVDGPSTVIGIVGMGGIGKTTLAQKICHSESVKNSFNHLVFVTVSQSFKLNELLKKMLKKLDIEEESLGGNDVVELLESLNRKLDAKYLVVLDDVWETNEGMWWDSLKSGLPQVEGSCVIVTTRNEEVAKSMGARIHYLQCLSNEDSWSFFSKVAFARTGGKCTNPDLEGLGKEIVARCGGLPLAIKVVAGMMLGKSDSIHEWRRISEHLKDELKISGKDEPVISSLELSYEELPAHLKPCFLCFAMFPEDFEIDVEDMVNWWIGEGFVCGKNGKTAVEIGEECLSELFNRFLILGIDKDDFERSYVRCKMHDMVRDMVIRIAREESFFVRLDCGGSPAFSEQSRRLGIVGNTAVESIGNSSTKLRTLVGKDIQSKEMIASLKAKLCKVRWLRVLSLSLPDWNLDGDVVCSDWLSGIGSLQHLVYLNIESSALKSLPDSIGKLRNLRILSLWNCPNLKRLPVSITTLEKLTAIQIFGCGSLECMPEGIGKLSNLEWLGWFNPVNKNGSRISDLKNLTKLRELCMEIKSVEEIEEGEWNVLSMLQHLQILKLDFGRISVERDAVVRKMEGELSPPLKSLRELYLWKWPGERTPAWLSPTSLPNLQFLYIESGGIREMGPRFWDSESGVWKVEVLVLGWIKEMDEEWQRMRKAMPSLRLLKVRNCPKLKSFPFDVTDGGDEKKWRKEEEDSATGAVEEEEKGDKFYSFAREEEGNKFYSFPREEEGDKIFSISFINHPLHAILTTS